MNRNSMIGSAWVGKHVVMITCDIKNNRFLRISSSIHAPMEPVHVTCAETIAQFLRIGYQISYVTALNSEETLFILTQ
ncbi:hypothetical protein EJF36_08105 [Bacillus sp. HMF5848]|uniref:hypothetical protein n=1 Tax=Bacillus sp. HMF5848 TaxID=2495421 RepID=UPI000F79861E|nr:hypothetical protein [Bacillus sp. HMF5848]RSK26828.1 hypothetical protein EJF36_08105 [Bacillus sp. HMF5848]